MIRLPVIFHEVNTNMLTADYVRQLTDGMTKAYCNRLNLSNGPKDENAKDLFVEFYPAETGLNRKRLPIPGLDKVNSQITSFTFNNAYSEAFESFWDPENYINVWVFSNITDDYKYSSWAYFPYVTVPMDGFRMATKGTEPFLPFGIFLNGSHVKMNQEGNRTEETLAHEAGHLLGLEHVFDGNGSVSNSCSSRDPDYCKDTPYYDRGSYTENHSFGSRYLRNSCNGITYSATNFIDYYYSYNNSFTSDQAKRVRHTIDYGLWLPTPFNSSSSARTTGELSLVKRSTNLKYVEPIICKKPY